MTTDMVSLEGVCAGGMLLTAFFSMGRKRLPTTVIGLLTHMAEHTQRHVGQAIAAAKLAAVL